MSAVPAACSPVPVSQPAGTKLLGEVISWTCSGVAVTHPALVDALSAFSSSSSCAKSALLAVTTAL